MQRREINASNCAAHPPREGSLHDVVDEVARHLGGNLEVSPSLLREIRDQPVEIVLLARVVIAPEVPRPALFRLAVVLRRAEGGLARKLREVGGLCIFAAENLRRERRLSERAGSGKEDPQGDGGRGWTVLLAEQYLQASGIEGRV